MFTYFLVTLNSFFEMIFWEQNDDMSHELKQNTPVIFGPKCPPTANSYLVWHP